MPDDTIGEPGRGHVHALHRALRAHERAIETHERAARLFRGLKRHELAEAEVAAAERERGRRDHALAELARLEEPA